MAKNQASKPVAKARRGRPQFNPTAELRQVVFEHASQGLSERKIAQRLGVAYLTVRRHFSEQLVAGRAAASESKALGKRVAAAADLEEAGAIVEQAAAAELEVQAPGAGPGAPPIAEKDPVGAVALADYARRHAKLAIDALMRIATSGESETAAANAAEKVLIWGYGKPLGIGKETIRSPGEKAAEAAGKKAPELGKKEALKLAANNPDPTSPMGKLIAQRRATTSELN